MFHYSEVEDKSAPHQQDHPSPGKVLCVGCGVINSFNGDQMEQCNTCNTTFRTSLCLLTAVSGQAVRCPVRRGHNITLNSTDKNDDKRAWLTQLLGSLISLLQEDWELKLEVFTTGGNMD